MAVSTSLDGYKEPRLGTIPDDWETVTLSEVVAFTQKPRDLQVGDYERIPFLPMELIPDNGLEPLALLTRAGVEIKSGTYFEVGDVLLAKITPSFENGKQAIVGDLPLPFGYATTEVFPLRPRQKDRLSPLFLFYYLKHPSVRSDIANRMEGTTGRQRVPRAVLENYLLPLPPFPEQKRIAHVLRTIQTAIETQERVIKAAREFNRSLMHHLFTCGPYAEGITTREIEAGKLPVHWEIVPLGEVAELVNSGATPRGGRKVYRSSGIPFLRSQNVLINRLLLEDVAYITPEVHRKMSRSQVQPNDILLNITGASIGRVTCVPESFPTANVNQHVCRIRLKKGRALPRYVSYYLATPSAQAEIMGTQFGATRQGLNYGQVRALRIPLPPPVEQKRIAEVLAAADRKLDSEVNRKTALESLFKSMLHNLMTGQIRVHNLEVEL